MTLDGAAAVFAIGSAGGALAELLHWWNLRETTQLPAYAKSPLYWILTVLMILAGGFVAWLYFGQHAEAILTLNVGLAAPLILQKLVTAVPQQAGGKSLVVEPAPSIRNFFTW